MNFLTRALEWLLSLDAPTRAAVIGASATLVSVVVALVGVFVNVWWNRHKHREDRAVALKREAYISAAGAIADSFQWLSLLADPATELRDGNPILVRLAGALSAVHILGDGKTVAAVIQFQRAYLTRYVPAILIKGRMAGDNITLEYKNRQRDGLVAVDNQAITLQPMKRLTDEIQQLHENIFRSQAELLENALSATHAISPLIRSLTIAFRREFKLPIDEAWYESEMTELATFADELARENIAMVTPRGRPPGNT